MNEAKIEFEGYSVFVRLKKANNKYQPDIVIVRDVLHSVTDIPSPQVNKTFNNKKQALAYGLACAKDYINKRLNK